MSDPWHAGSPAKRMAYRVELERIRLERVRVGRRRALRAEAVWLGAMGVGLFWIAGQAGRLEAIGIVIGIVLAVIGGGLVAIGAAKWRAASVVSR